jgi:DNA polymerase-3 subunit delta'
MWDSVIGQTRVKNLLRTAIERGRIAHAYLFYGEEGAGMDAMAIEFARVLNCDTGKLDACGACPSCRKFSTLQHANLRLIFALPRGRNEKEDEPPIKALEDSEIKLIQNQISLKAKNPYHRIDIPRANEIRINSVRDLRRDAALTPFASGWKVYLLLDADQMNTTASNALLKTLEEPSERSVLVLTTSKRERLLSTILSRCQALRFDSLTVEEIRDALMSRHSIPQERAELVAVLANGNYSRALELLDTDVSERRDVVVAFLRNALGGKAIPLLAQIDELTRGTDRSGIEQMLSLMVLWFRDAELLRANKVAGLVNVDHVDVLKNFVHRYPNCDLGAAISSVERAIALVGRNVYLPLVLTHLAFELKRSTSQKDRLEKTKLP